jgi:hypothetical protein
VPQIEFEKTALGVRYNLVKDPPNGNRFVRLAEYIVPNAFIIPNIREAGTLPKQRELGSELSLAVPVDNEHVTGLSIVACARGWCAEERLAAGHRQGSGHSAGLGPNQEI